MTQYLNTEGNLNYDSLSSPFQHRVDSAQDTQVEGDMGSKHNPPLSL